MYVNNYGYHGNNNSDNSLLRRYQTIDLEGSYTIQNKSDQEHATITVILLRGLCYVAGIT